MRIHCTAAASAARGSEMTVLRPGRVSGYVLRAYFAIEAADGAFERWGIGVGDIIEVKG